MLSFIFFIQGILFTSVIIFSEWIFRSGIAGSCKILSCLILVTFPFRRAVLEKISSKDPFSIALPTFSVLCGIWCVCILTFWVVKISHLNSASLITCEVEHFIFYFLDLFWKDILKDHKILNLVSLFYYLTSLNNLIFDYFFSWFSFTA